MNFSNGGLVLALVVGVLAILGMVGVLPFSSTVVFALIAVLAAARLC